MDIIEESFRELFPGKEFVYNTSLKYSGKFNGYNANIRIRDDIIIFNLSRNWKEISKEIKMGLLQEMMVRAFRKKFHITKLQTTNMDLYNLFMKNLHISIPKTNQDPLLLQSFERVNEKYFYGMLEAPNLIFGTSSIRKLGSYDFGSDTIKISTIFRDKDPDMLDYIMYHEMLHKKQKFRHKNGRSYHHTREFRQKEKEFENSISIDKKIRSMLTKKSFFSIFSRM